MPWPHRKNDPEVLPALWRMADEFGRKEARWLPYWKNAEYVAAGPEGAYVSLYLHPKNGVLAVISNLSRKEQEVSVRLNLDRLGLRGGPLAGKALFGKNIEIARDGVIKMRLPSLGWKAVWIRPRE